MREGKNATRNNQDIIKICVFSYAVQNKIDFEELIL